MARIETWFNQDLKKPVKVHYLDGNVFSMDNQGNIVGVNVFDNEYPASLSGTVAANVIRADGATVSVSGTLSDNKCYIVLPQTAYAVPGVISIIIKLTSGSDITTLCAIVANVYQSSTDSTVDPGTIIPSIETLIAEIEEAVATIPADYSSLWTSLAPTFDSGQAYFPGQYVTYDGDLWKCNTIHSGSWNASHFDTTKIGNELFALTQGLALLNVYDKDNVLDDKAINTSNGTVYSADGYYTTGYIYVVPGSKLIASLNGLPSGFLFIATYNSAKTFIRCYTDIKEEYAVEDGVFYVRICNSSSSRPKANFRVDYDYLTSYFVKTSLLENGGIWVNANCLLRDNGTTMYNAAWGNYAVSDYIPVSLIAGMTVRNAVCYPAAQGNCIAFYDRNKTLINTPYVPAGVSSSSQPVTFKITPDLLSAYPGAAFCRIGMAYDYGTRILNDNELSLISNVYPSYKVNAYPKIFFGGDSVTEGFVVEGTESNPETIYEVMPEQSYPACFGRIFAGANITTVAQSGISPLNYYAQKYPDIDFSQYNIIVIELGLNGGLDIDDIDTSDTNTWALKQIIAGIRSQNADAQVALVRSQYWLATADAKSVFTTLCSSYNCMFFDLHTTKYLNLADPIYHGYFLDDGTATLDYAHFSRKGYAAKAYVIAKMLGEMLPE